MHPTDDSTLASLSRLIERTASSEGVEGGPSILSLAAVSFGRLDDPESTMPTGFDSRAVRIFESVVEAAYLVAIADGIFDETERHTFARVVAAATGGRVEEDRIDALVTMLSSLHSEQGTAARIARLVEPLTSEDQLWEALRVASLLAAASDGIQDAERDVIRAIATARGAAISLADRAMDEARTHLAR